MQGLELLKDFYKEMESADDDEINALVENPYLVMTIENIEVVLAFDQSEPDKLSLKADIGQIDIANPANMGILVILLEGNFEFSGTRGATIGVNSSSGEVCLFYELTCHEVSQAALQQLLVEFSEVGRLWQETLVALSQGVV